MNVRSQAPASSSNWRNVRKLFDVNIAGVSMVTTHRNAFSADVKKSGLDSLIKVLKQKSMEVGA